MSSLLLLRQLQRPPVRFFKLPTEGGHRAWDAGMGIPKWNTGSYPERTHHLVALQILASGGLEDC